MTVIRRMALTALVIGTAMAAVGTGRVTLPLILSTTVLWSFVPVLQLLTGLILVHGRGPSRREALAAYFATGHYWAIWILGMSALLLLVPSAFGIWPRLALSFVVPSVLTARALARLRWRLFGDTHAAAWRRVMFHQAITHLMIWVYFSWAVALWTRLPWVSGR